MKEIFSIDREIRAKLGNRIKNIRRMKEISREELAERIGLGVSTVYRVEQGLAPIDLGRIGLFAAALEVTEEEVQSVLKEEK